MDGKRFALCFLRKIWVLAAAGAAGALLAAGIYLADALLLSGGPQYEAFSQYRIYFDSETYGEIEDYYNAYTWGDIMRTDQVLDFVMEELDGSVTKEQVKTSVSVGQMNDIKIMPLSVITQDPELSDRIARAYSVSLDRFAKSIRGLSGMECWLIEPAKEVPRATKTGNAAALGFLLGAVGAFLVLLIRYCVDDSVYVEEDFCARYPWPFLGIATGRKDGEFDRELAANWAHLTRGKEKIWLAGAGAEEKKALEACVGSLEGCETAAWPFDGDSLERMRRSDGAVLVFPWGGHNGRIVAHMAAQLEKQQVTVLGAAAYGADEKFLRAYYGRRRN